MLIIRLPSASDQDVSGVVAVVREHGEFVRQVRLGSDVFVLLQMQGPTDQSLSRFTDLPGVASGFALDTPFILSSRAFVPTRTCVRIRPDLHIGGDEFVVMAGPCTVETEDQVRTTAESVRASGARILRGGSYKPRTSPFSFQGLQQAGLGILHRVSKELDLPVVSEVMAPHQLEDVHPLVDVLQVGMRNSLNYPLLTAIGEHPKHPPVLLKCGIGTSLDEFLCAADYILAGGNPNVILCLRGRVGLSEYTRSALNINDVPVLRRLTHLPIVVDPSHAAGRRDIVPAMSAAALAAGADGLLVEVHNRPEASLVDGSQSLTLAGFERMMRRLRQLARGMGRTMSDDLGSTAAGSTAAGGNHPYEDLDLEAPSTQAEPFDENLQI